MPTELHRSLELLHFAGAHRRHTEALRRATGEHYNIFKILGIGHYEVRTHSPILGDLLNRKGTHSQGDAFLRILVQGMGIEGFDTASSRVDLEYYAGPVTEKSGGRIDIRITDDHGNEIVIENKIYAGDQENQLERYRATRPQAKLFYLTLQGDLPAGYDDAKLEALQVTRLSYATDIRDWLIACQQVAAARPHVRETISQYLYLVRELTGQSTTSAMNADLIRNITNDPETLGAYFELAAEMQKVQEELVAKLDQQLDTAAQTAGVIRDGRITDLHAKYAGFDFYTETLAKHNLRISFCFDQGGYQNLDFGFARNDKNIPCPINEQLWAGFSERFPGGGHNEWWLAWAHFESPYGYWGAEAFQGIVTGDLAKNIEQKLIALARIAQEVYAE
jgi:hypothetical protein